MRGSRHILDSWWNVTAGTPRMPQCAKNRVGNARLILIRVVSVISSLFHAPMKQQQNQQQHNNIRVPVRKKSAVRSVPVDVVGPLAVRGTAEEVAAAAAVAPPSSAASTSRVKRATVSAGRVARRGARADRPRLQANGKVYPADESLKS